MNICFLIGKILNDIDFKFIVDDKKYYAIAIFQIELNNKSVITVKGLNEIADYCYGNLNKNDYCVIEGTIASNFNILLQNITKMEYNDFNYDN